MAKMTATELKSHLAGFTGTENYHRWSILSRMVLTDGAKSLAEEAGAYWLMDAIASHQPKALRDPKLQEIQFWKLKAKDGKAVLTCERDTDDVAITQRIAFTDFPMDEVKLWVQNGVIMLPSEY